MSNPSPTLTESMERFGSTYYVAKCSLAASGDTLNLFMFPESEDSSQSNVAFATCLPATDEEGMDISKEFRAGTRLIAPVFTPWQDENGVDMPAEWAETKQDDNGRDLPALLIHRVDITAVEKVIKPVSRAAANLRVLRAV